MLLPPSETKRDGGTEGSALRLAGLSFAGLTPARRTVLAGLRTLSRNLSAMAVALRLGPHQHAELVRNRHVTTSPVLPAMDRYAGVLYEAFGATGLPDAARAFAGAHVAVHSALFGLVAADDAIPAYRLSHDSRLPGIRLGQLWRAPVAEAIRDRGGLVLDLRSEAYVRLGPVPPGVDSWFVRVVTEGADGTRRALNHFNKKGKGAFVRALAESSTDHEDVASLLSWAQTAGFRLHRCGPGELELVV